MINLCFLWIGFNKRQRVTPLIDQQIQLNKIVENPEVELPLPVYLFAELNQYLHYTDLLSLKLVSHRFYKFFYKGLSTLTRLNLQKCTSLGLVITDFIPKLGALNALDLTDSTYDKKTAESLLRVKRLKELNLTKYLSNSIFPYKKLKKFTALQSLNLSDNRCITNCHFLFTLTNLEHLVLSNASTNEIVSFSALTGLTHLDASNLRAPRWDSRSLSSLTNLMSLNIKDTSVTDEVFSIISKLTRLTYLNVAALTEYDLHNSFEYGALSTLTNLEVLKIAYNAIEVTGLNRICSLTRLQTLDLSDCTFSINEAKSISKLTRLQTLKLADTQLPASFSFSPFVTLLQLDISNIGLDKIALGDAEIMALEINPRISILNLRRIKLTDQGLMKLTYLTNLTWLNLFQSSVTRDGLDQFTSLQQLSGSKIDIPHYHIYPAESLINRLFNRMFGARSCPFMDEIAL